MSFEALKWYARQHTVVTAKPTSLTINLQQVLPADPLRYAIIIPQLQGVSMRFAFSTNAPATEQFHSGSGTTGQWFSEDDLGGILGYPLWAAVFSATQTPTFYVFSYTPEMRRLLDDYVSRYISEFRSHGHA